MAGEDGNGYDVTGVAAVEESEGIDHIVTYDFTATDGDLDPALGDFDVAFDDGDGVLEEGLDTLVPPVEEGDE
jgi:hypothetical protein